MKSILMMMFTLIASTSLFAQPGENGKNVEMSISGSYQSYSNGGSSQSTSAFLLSPRVGVFVFEGLELEPEITALFPSSSEPVYCLNGNVSYNFKIGMGNGVPFLLVGYGIANTVPVFNLPTFKSDFSFGVLNLGAGIKAFLSNDIAIRVEYRYQNFTGQSTSSMFGFTSFTQKVDARINTVQFGLSVFL